MGDESFSCQPIYDIPENDQCITLNINIQSMFSLVRFELFMAVTIKCFPFFEINAGEKYLPL
jgi:hypothetical protein